MAVSLRRLRKNRQCIDIGQQKTLTTFLNREAESSPSNIKYMDRTSRKCQYCGNMFSGIPCIIQKRKFCSRTCHFNSKKQKVIHVECEQCGVTFIPKDLNRNHLRRRARRFCSRVCSGLARRQRRDIKCKNCGKMCSKRISLINKYEKNFCSTPCFNEWKKKQRITQNCEVCGKEFKVHMCSEGKYKCCSSECRLLRLRQIRKPLQNAISAIKKCNVCGREFKVYHPSQIAIRKVCSSTCKYKQHREYITKLKSKFVVITKNCEVCRKHFSYRNLKKDKNRRFCSARCAVVYAKQFNKIHGKQQPTSIVCKGCGKQYQVKNQYTANHKSFCSYKCFNRSLYKNVPQTINCKMCMKEVKIRRPGDFRNKKGFCSTSCGIKFACKQNPYRSKKFCKIDYKRCERCNKLFCGLVAAVRKRRFCSYECSRHVINKPTKFQNDVFEKVRQLFPESSMEYRIKKWFTDIFVPDKNICFECDGNYWHSEKHRKNKPEQDRLRQEAIESLGYRVVRIPELEWKKDPNIFRYI